VPRSTKGGDPKPPRTSPDVQLFLKIWILCLGGFRWINPNGGQNGGQAHSQTKEQVAQVQAVARDPPNSCMVSRSVIAVGRVSGEPGQIPHPV
jgi:hypothetical protein